MKNPYLYIFYGAPGCGKSEALHFLTSFDHTPSVIIQKETTRHPRTTDNVEIRSVKCLSPQCDIRYTQYGIEYGFSSKLIWGIFAINKCAAVIVNDIRTIRILKKKFGVLAKCIYIHRNVTDKDIRELALKRHPINVGNEIDKDTEKRIKKIKNIYGKYIENTALFDYTILNVGTLEDFKKQLVNIITDRSLERRRIKSKVKIFIIAGSSYSEKDELVNAMVQMEPKLISKYRKYSTRLKEEEDNDDLNHVNHIPQICDVTYYMNTHKYGISSEQLWDSLSKGTINLLVLSDTKCIEKLINKFGEICTVIYLHANLNSEEIEEKMKDRGLEKDEIGARIDVMNNLFNLYTERTTMFDHVLLNTAEREDLYDQAFNILDFYSSTE